MLEYGISSADYHGRAGYASSTQLKDLLDDPEIYHKKHVTKELAKDSSPVFDLGSYFHTAILEPDKLLQDCAVYGGIRRGKEWEAFQLEHKGKTIITESESKQAEMLISAVKNSSVAMGRIDRCESEVSAFIQVTVANGEIYHHMEDNDLSRILGPHGWESMNQKKIPKGITLGLKARADALNEDFILDLKSTTGNAKSSFTMRRKISDYSYDLSAAFYLDVFTIASRRLISEFLWTFASKDCGNSKTYIATDKNIQVGRAKWKKAIVTLADCMATDWEFEDSIGYLEPNGFEEEWIKPQGKDLL